MSEIAGTAASDRVPVFPANVDADYFNQASRGKLPGHLGIHIESVERGLLRSRLEVREEHHAPNGFLHAATVVALADTSAGYGCVASLPEGARGFTTIELKSNFLGTVRDGAITCVARLIHGGRMTQVWDAEVRDGASNNVIALFRCTQMILYPRT